MSIKNLTKIALTGTLAAAIAFTSAGCFNKVYQEGNVINETFDRYNQTYTLTVETKEGDYAINVHDEPVFIFPSMSKKIESLEKTIEIGDSIKFLITVSYTPRGWPKPLFDKRVGSLPANEIKVLKK